MTKSLGLEKINEKEIFYFFKEPDMPSRKIVIMAHGFRGTSVGPARGFVNFSSLLLKHGYSTLRFDMPNSGNSEGDFLEVSFKEWVSTIVYFANKYLKLGYQITLLGQSMGATASVIAASEDNLKENINALLLWVPDPESDFAGDPNSISEENGEKFHMSFWKEAHEMNFFKCLKEYNGKIHLVYGEKDKYVSKDLRNKTIQLVKEKNQKTMILKGQDHSPWEYDISLSVFNEELNFIKED